MNNTGTLPTQVSPGRRGEKTQTPKGTTAQTRKQTTRGKRGGHILCRQIPRILQRKNKPMGVNKRCQKPRRYMASPAFCLSEPQCELERARKHCPRKDLEARHCPGSCSEKPHVQNRSLGTLSLFSATQHSTSQAPHTGETPHRRILLTGFRVNK